MNSDQTARKKRSSASPAPKPVSVKGKAGQNRTRKRRRKKSRRQALRRKWIRRISFWLIALVLLAAGWFCLTNTIIGGAIYPLSLRQIDLQGQNLTDAKPIARLTLLDRANLSDNEITDASPLTSLTRCRFIDLTNNPVSAASVRQLREALPSCLILSEAEDYTITFMALGFYELPDCDTLIRVLEAHRALETVDLRGAFLSDDEINRLCAAFPHIRFIRSSETGQGVTFRIDSAAEADRCIELVPDYTRYTFVGCTFTPDEYRALTAGHQDLDIDCLIDLGGMLYSAVAEEIDVSHLPIGDLTWQTLRTFARLNTLTLGEALPSQAAHFQEMLGLTSVRFACGGLSVSEDMTEIDLTQMQWLTASELEALLAVAPNLRSVRMNPPDEPLTAVIRRHASRVHFIYETEAFGQTFSTGAEQLDLGGAVTDGDADRLMELIASMHNLKKVDMYESTLSMESMNRLFDSCPDVFFGWTFSICGGKYRIRTDMTAFSTMLGSPRYQFTEEDFLPLRFCKNLQALDLGHNAVSDVSFLRAFPHLKVLILADNRVTDISPLADLRELEYLELFMLYDLTDYSPLSGLPLIDLNVRCEQNERHTLEIDAFLNMTTLERLWISEGHFTEEEERRLRDALPDCLISISESHATGNGWRRHNRYEVIERMFDRNEYEPFS